MTCRATFELVIHPSQLRGTHTCDLPSGHGASHHCPRCGCEWTTPARRRQAGATAASIAAARLGVSP